MTTLAQAPPYQPAEHDSVAVLTEDLPEDDDVLMAEITTLAGHIAAATCRFLILLGELDAREAWSGVGVLSTAHWLSLHCGLGGVAARDHVRVARALRRLPRTVEAFAAGRLSYSKVRAITRIATALNEGDLVEIALAAPANHVERLIRGVEAAQDLDQTRERADRRQLRWWWAEDGSLCVSARLPPEDGSVVVEVLQATAARAAEDGADEDGADTARPEADDGDDPRRRIGRSMADALVEICETAGRVSDDDARWGYSRETAVHVTLSDLAEPPHGDGGTSGARGGQGDSRTAPPPVPDRDSTRAAGTTPSRRVPAARGLGAVLHGPRLAHGPLLHREVARRLACDGGIVLHIDSHGNPRASGATLEVGKRVRRPSAAQMRALWARDGGCRYPNCRRRRNLHAHHIVFWADGGPTELTNLVLLCGAHHRLLHEGEFSLTRDEGGDVLVRAPDGGLVRATPPPPGSVAGAENVAGGRGVSIGPETVGGHWSGEPLNVGYATSVLMTNWDRRSAGQGDG